MDSAARKVAPPPPLPTPAELAAARRALGRERYPSMTSREVKYLIIERFNEFCEAYARGDDMSPWGLGGGFILDDDQVDDLRMPHWIHLKFRRVPGGWDGLDLNAGDWTELDETFRNAGWSIRLGVGSRMTPVYQAIETHANLKWTVEWRRFPAHLLGVDEEIDDDDSQ